MLFHLFSFTILSAILGVSGMKDKLLLVTALEGLQSMGQSDMFTSSYRTRMNVIQCHGGRKILTNGNGEREECWVTQKV